MSYRARVVSAAAGFRGAVSLAIALSVPLTLQDGTTFPARDDIIVVTAGVIVLTLLVQGPLLPVVVRWADLPADLPLAGTGLGTPSLTISPDDYSFPDTPVGTNSLVQVFRVTNEGTGPAWFNVEGTSADIYSVYFTRDLAPEGCNFRQELDPGQSCNVAASALPHVRGPLVGLLYAKFFANPDAVSGTEYDAQAVLHVTGI
jgi:hypothetical protein